MDGLVDVVLLTKNSQRVLQECVKSIYQNVPVNQLIVVDAYSKDRTLQILNQFNQKYHNIRVVFDVGTRATARQKGIQRVSTEWFLFVDSDVILCKGWYKEAQKFITPNVGAVWGTEVWSTIKNKNVLKLFLLVTRKIFDVRGGTHDTLIRASAVKGINIPSNLHVFEDAYIKDWIERKGYHVTPCYVPFCIHFRPRDVWTFQGSLGLAAEALRIGNPRLIGKLLFAYGFYAAYSIYQLLKEN